MQLGEKLGDGAVSEVFAYGDGRVLKLFKAGISQALVDHEARITRAANEAGAPAPEVFGVEEVDGRSGVVLPRYDGSTLLRLVLRGEMAAREAGATLARAHHALHAGRYQAAVPGFRDWAMHSAGRLRKSGTPEDVLDRVQEVVMSLPERGVLCHGDLHVDNILMTASGPVIIDWISAVSAEPYLDVARQHLTLTVLPFDAEYEQLRSDADAGFIATYAELSNVSEDELLEAITPYMIVMAAMRMNEAACAPAERALLEEHIRAAP